MTESSLATASVNLLTNIGCTPSGPTCCVCLLSVSGPYPTSLPLPFQSLPWGTTLWEASEKNLPANWGSSDISVDGFNLRQVLALLSLPACCSSISYLVLFSLVYLLACLFVFFFFGLHFHLPYVSFLVWSQSEILTEARPTSCHTYLILAILESSWITCTELISPPSTCWTAPQLVSP